MLVTVVEIRIDAGTFFKKIYRQSDPNSSRTQTILVDVFRVSPQSLE